MYSLRLPRISSNSTHIIALEINKNTYDFLVGWGFVFWNAADYLVAVSSSRGRFCVRCMHELKQELIF